MSKDKKNSGEKAETKAAVKLEGATAENPREKAFEESTNNHARYLGSAYLEHVKLTSFGRFANTIVGPFKPGLNVVLGSNEAGKTTISELIKGVMFGWQASRKGTNSYKPENAERIGSLFFKSLNTGDVDEIKRAKNTEGVSDTFHVLDDIDKETYDTMFALTSDELLKLDRHNDVTARLLTAGSGTAASPAQVLGTIQDDVKSLMSRSAQNPNSIALLREEQAHVKSQVQQLLNETENLREQERHQDALLVRKQTLTEAQTALNAEVEELKSNRARLEQVDVSLEQNKTLLDETVLSIEQTQLTATDKADEDISALAQLSASEEFQLKANLDDLDEERMKLEHALDNAKRDAAKSKAAFETVLNNVTYQSEQARGRKQRVIRIVVAVIIMLCMGVVGIWSFMQGRAVGSFSYSAFGIILCLAALMIGAAGVVANLHPSKTEEAVEQRRHDYEWVMQQDAQHCDLCERDLAEHKLKIKWFLDKNNLASAQGSIRQARNLIELAHDLRNNEETTKQNLQALTLQRASLESLIKNLREQRRDLCRSMDLEPRASLSEVDAMIARKSTERDKTAQLISDTDLRYGQITSELSHAKHQTTFDAAKQRKEIVEAKLEEQYWQLAKLLLAQRSLDIAIAEWERKSQPEVYLQASRLFAQMTGGKWQTVRMNAEGDIEVLDSVRSATPPQLLSLGTRQQLYLALRVALLMTAENVGRSLPILCDDILVNFDDTRRLEAIKVLAELSRYRQVILFTCHPSVAALIRDADCPSNHLEL